MMAFVPHADNITSRMAYVPFVHMNHVLVNAPYVPNLQPQPLFNPATDTLNFNIIYTPKSEILSQYRKSYPKAIVPHWLEISEMISYQTAIKSDAQISKITSIFDSTVDKTICFDSDVISCSSNFRIWDYIGTQFLSFYIKLRSSPILTFYIHFLISILSIFDISLKTTNIAYKLQYSFIRNCMLYHDYIVLLQKLNSDYLQIVYPLRFSSILILQHIKIINITLLPYRFVVFKLNQLVKYSQIYKINTLKKTKPRLTGSGPSNTFLSSDLA